MRNIYNGEDFNEKYEKVDDVFVDLHHERNSTSKLIVAIIVITVAIFVFNFCKYVFQNAISTNEFNFEKFENGLSKTFNSTNEIIDEEFDCHSIDEVFIDLYAANIEIEEVENSDKINVEVFADDEESIEVYYYSDEYDWRTINVVSLDTMYSWDFENRIPVIKISIPNTYEGGFFINLPFGNVEMGNFEHSNVSLMSDAGDVTIGGAESISANLSYGSLKIGKVDTIYSLCSCGDIQIDEVNSSCSLDVDLGNVEIENLNVKTSSDIKVNCGNVAIENTGDIDIEAETSLGDVSIAHSNESSHIKLTAIVDAGNINIK